MGYLRTYAAFLGLDVADCVRQFKAEVDCDAGRGEPTAPQERREIKLPRGLVGAVLILGGVVVAAGWYGNYVTRAEAFAGAAAPMDALMRAEAPLVELEASAPSRAAIWSGLPDANAGNTLVLEAGVGSTLKCGTRLAASSPRASWNRANSIVRLMSRALRFPRMMRAPCWCAPPDVRSAHWASRVRQSTMSRPPSSC